MPSPASRRRVVVGTLVFATLAVLVRLGEPELLSAYSFGHAVYDREGNLLRLTLAGDECYRLFVPLAEIPPALIEATLAYEDRAFFWHPGVNPVALAKAALGCLAGAGCRGASTISMQVARLRFGVVSRTLGGKLRQIWRALELELYYSKREILEAYLNLAPYGGNVEGVGAASRIYFDKEPRALSLAEALALAVIPQRPAERSPSLEGTEPAALAAARRLLSERYLSLHLEAQAEAANLVAPLRMRPRRDLPFGAPHFVTSLVRETPGQSLRTTLDRDLQTLVERRARAYVDRHRQQGIDNLAVLLADHRSMEVLAVLGSADFADAAIEGQVNGTTARRSPGSTLKPLVYALALEQGLIHPRSLLKDAPMRFGAYNPENFDNEFVGPSSATEALVHSRNVPAVSLETRLQQGGLHGLLARAGIHGLASREHYGLAIVLGAVEISMEELVELYAMLANGGVLRPLRRTVAEPQGAPRRLLSAEAAALTLEMLRDDPRPEQTYRSEWVRDESPVAWKTGTSFGYRDAWSVGVVGPYVLAVWVGHFDGRGNPAFVGRRAAAPLFFEIADGLRPRLAGAISWDLARPGAYADLHLVEAEVCATSGMLPAAHCPRTRKTWFIPGVSPIDRCDIHREIWIDRDGRRACAPGAPGTRAAVYEFWPSDLCKLFAQAGLARREVPPYARACGLEERAGRGRAPEITSPQRGITYHLRPDRLAEATIALTAIADADVRTLRWFAGDEYLGESRRDEPLFWRGRPGELVIRVVDDNGRSDSEPMTVALVGE